MADVSSSVETLRDELDALRQTVSALDEALAAPQQAIAELLTVQRADIHERASLAAVGGPRLLSDALTIEGDPGLRMRIRRLRVGEPVERPFSRWIGVTRCASTSPDVRELWDGLIAAESNREDDVLRGKPSTILDIPDAVVSPGGAGRLLVSMQRSPAPMAGALPVLAIPKFTYAFPPRKLRNFGHWLVDCVPQVAALSTVAPRATVLVPPPQKPFQEWALSLSGVGTAQLATWDGAAVAAQRVLVFESDGRTGGGRPLSALTAFRRQLRAESGDRGVRRIYVTRRDARNKRKWISNEPAIEQMFRSRGFEVLSMAECPLEEQARIFRDAHVVAGISGAGLTDLIFSAPGTHAIVLLSDSLIRWYADRRGARSLWSGGARGSGGRLAALGDSPRFYAHLAAAFEQYCHSFVGGDDMPLEPLTAFVDDVLARVDGA